MYQSWQRDAEKKNDVWGDIGMRGTFSIDMVRRVLFE